MLNLKNKLNKFIDLNLLNIRMSKSSHVDIQLLKDCKRFEDIEFSVFSQNGEDGIINYLTTLLIMPTYNFLEIGSGNSIENNSSFLSFIKKYNGIAVEGNQKLSARAQYSFQSLNLGVQYQHLFVTPENVVDLIDDNNRNCDFFSLDIDGVDYYIAKSLFEHGFRPKIVCVEYNAVFGPNDECTVEYTTNFDYRKEEYMQLYYGVSYSAWLRFFEQYDYEFVTCDRNGVNMFFIDKSESDASIELPMPIEFRDNYFQRRLFGKSWADQRKLIDHLHLVYV